jgi:murein DD-endopeptidase MepM/ murein hydrolase activator NlpD
MSARRRRGPRRPPGISLRTLQGLLMLGAVAIGFAALLLQNARSVQSFAVPVGAVASPTPTRFDWQGLLATQFLLNATPIPTADTSVVYVPPTPGWGVFGTPVAFEPAQIVGARTATSASIASPTGTRSSPLPTPTATRPAPAATATPRADWNPPPMSVPLALDPRDHFWLIRPIDSDRINYGLEWYPYGSNGPDDNLRVHHGEDLGNPRGVRVRAAADGTVIWADNGIYTTRRNGATEHITSYGNVMVIEHNFSYRGQSAYTLYAHLSAFVKRAGERVSAGETIGLVGATGLVGGPHLHFEVRIGWNSYYETRNPYLWMAPYVGHGVIAGRVTYADGTTVDDNTVTLIDQSTGRVLRRYSTYGPGVNPDSEWNENFVFGDVPAGEYWVVTWIGNERISAEATVLAGATSFVELVGTEHIVPATPQDVLP